MTGSSASTTKPSTMDEQNKKNFANEPLAICGMGIRIKGGNRNENDLCKLLEEQIHPVFGSDEKRADGENGLEGDGRIPSDAKSNFDAAFFSVSTEATNRCNTQELQLLEVTRECLDDAGEIGSRGSSASVGCYICVNGESTTQESAQSDKFTEVSRVFNLSGPR